MRRRGPKASLDELIGGEEIAAKVVRQQYETDDESSHDVSQDDLQKREIGVVRQPRNADDSQRAGLGGNDGQRNRPPGNVTSRQEVVAQRALAFAEAHAEQGDPDQIDGNDREV